MATAELKTLLANVKTNCLDTVNFTALGIKFAEIADEFAIPSKPTLSAVIVPSKVENEILLIQTVVYEQVISIYLCMRRLATPNHGRRLQGTSTVDGLINELRDLRLALDRGSPYNLRKPSSTPPTRAGTYTTQTSVEWAKFDAEEYEGEKDKQFDGESVATKVQVARLDMRYLIKDSRR